MKSIPNNLKVEYRPPDSLRANPRNPRTHSKQQIAQIGESIAKFGFVNPILVDEEAMVIAGHGRLAAAKEQRSDSVPVIVLAGLSEAQKKALMIADNKIGMNAGWDSDLLAEELRSLTEAVVDIGFDATITGFETGEIDVLLIDHDEEASEPDEETSPMPEKPIVRAGDLWLLGQHRLLCGDATEAEGYARLMKGDEAAMVFTDPPYNVPVNGHVMGRGKVRHEEFAMASGEMTPAAFTAFLTVVMKLLVSVSRSGSLNYLFMDAAHMREMLAAGDSAFERLVSLCIWAKTNAGQGSFYRHQTELVFVWRKAGAAHTNNIHLGKFGRNRSDLWTYAGANSFRAGRMDDLKAHPTVKPLMLVADAIKDATRRREIVLDPFAGSGTTILAADKVGRRGYGMEIEPKYVEVAIARWQAQAGQDARLEGSGKSFEEVRTERLAPVTRPRWLPAPKSARPAAKSDEAV
ncbi:site-specific DNA-methyltransferase [Phreatobacter sp.]|uniref:site-specific DNA-methyltransferase n=1 Tax=Phreatobacter sp. TaxID=1966341 RepID=UPI0025DA00BA|nr:DNA methyltransferase [Phreatobacter sp.]